MITILNLHYTGPAIIRAGEICQSSKVRISQPTSATCGDTPMFDNGAEKSYDSPLGLV